VLFRSWDANNFKLVQELKDVFNNNLMQLQLELDEIISLNEGSLRVGGSVSDTKVLNESTGLQRIFTPYIGVRSDDVQ
jgi:hypothetical protein